MSALPSEVSPTLRLGTRNLEWLPGPYVGEWLPCHLGGPQCSARREEVRNGYLTHMSAKWLHHSCRLWCPQRSAWGEEVITGTFLGGTFSVRTRSHKWLPGFSPTVLGIPNAQCKDKGGMFARCATTALSMVALAPSLFSPRQVPQVDHNVPWSCIATYQDQGVRFTNVRPSTVAKACIIAYHTHII